MPKISDERRAERRERILDAARTCFQHNGLHATTMDHIIRTSGLSAGAVYSYFPSKNALIEAAITASLSASRRLLASLLNRDPLPAPEELLREIISLITGPSTRDGFDLKRLALLGWSEAQRVERLRATMQDFYAAFHDQLTSACRNWQKAGLIDRAAELDEVAKALLALILGFMVQAAIMDDVEPDAIGRGAVQLGALVAGQPLPA